MSVEGTVVEVSIRDALASDAAPIAALVTQLGYPADGTAVAGRLAEWRENPLSRVLVATLGHRVAGMLALHAIPFFEKPGRRGRVVCLVVDEDVRGHGVGARLMRAAETYARRLGCVDIELTSARTRPEAHAFYRHVGYEDSCGRSARFLRPLAGGRT